jgi:hypothetical protein
MLLLKGTEDPVGAHGPDVQRGPVLQLAIYG